MRRRIASRKVMPAESQGSEMKFEDALVGGGSGRRGTLLRSCPPSRGCAASLLLYFAPQSAASSRSCADGFRFFARTGSAGSVGWGAQRSKGGEPARSGG